MLRRLLAYEQPYLGRRLAALFLLLISLGASMFLPWFLKQVVDQVIGAGQLEQLPAIAFSLLGIALAAGTAGYGQSYLSDLVGQRIIFDLRNQLYSHLLKLPFTYYDQIRTGELLSRLTGDVETLHRFLSFGMMGLLRNLFTFIIISYLLFTIDLRLTLLTMFIVPMVGYILYQFSTRVRPAFRAIQAQLASLTETLQEQVTGVRVVRAFGREEDSLVALEEENRGYLATNLTAQKLWAFYFPFLNFITSLATITVIWYGGRQVLAGQMTLGTLLAFESYLLLLMGPLRMVGWLINLASRAQAAGERIFQVLDEPPAPDKKQLTGPLGGPIQLEKVAFSYPDGPLVLEDINLTIERGEKVALVGPTGSGKSTLLQLIAGFYVPQRGRITIDGWDVTTVDLRNQVGMVFQESILFSATIGENIAFGRPGATQKELEEAAKIAGIHDFIMSLPDDYATPVGERGVGLSGGQRQRIALARALIMKPPILLLDDFTASVDALTEADIQDQLLASLGDQTVVFVAHRPSTIELADRVVYLERQIREVGSAQDLLAAGGPFARLMGEAEG
ncbi:MAG: ABC transporter ATP-binding protein [Limnochordia bacterium]